MAAKVAQWGPDVMRYVEKTILLQTLDHLWREHLIMLDHLRQVIGLRGYGQRDPLQEYKSEAFSLFEAMIAHLREAVTAQLMRVEIVPPEEQQPVLPPMEAHKLDPNTGEDEMAFANASLVPAGRRRRPRSEEPRKLGQGRPQRGLPLRVRQEVQALPRALRLSGRWANTFNEPSWRIDRRLSEGISTRVMLADLQAAARMEGARYVGAGSLFSSATMPAFGFRPRADISGGG